MGVIRDFFRRFKKRQYVLPEMSIDVPMPLVKDSFELINRRESVVGLSNNPINIRVRSRGLTHYSEGVTTWVPPQYDHYEIEAVFDIESYFARATRAKLALSAKGGHEFVGPEDIRVEYVRARWRQIERVTGIPLAILILLALRDLFVHSNAYWLKVRKASASGGKVRNINGTKREPIAGYFPLAPETMTPQIDPNGNIVGWRQDVAGFERTYSLDSIVHFYINKKNGYPLGVPSIIPVLDDILTLRQMEANVEALVQKQLFPIILWKIGTDKRPATVFPDGESEVTHIRDEIANMPTEGSIVVPERYDVKAIGAEGQALRVETYLEHFKQRILAGLDVSSIDVGLSDSSNRSTSDTLSKSLVSNVKLHQQTVQDFINLHVISELLLESTFEPSSVLDEEYSVHLRFREIDTQEKTLKENHAMDMFLKNAITYPELREQLSLEPLLPEEEKELWWYKFGREMALIASVDESSGKGVDDSGSIDNKNKPENQYGKKETPKTNQDSVLPFIQIDNPLLRWHRSLGKELQSKWDSDSFRISETISSIITTYELARTDVNSIIRSDIRMAYPSPDRYYILAKLSEQRTLKQITRFRDELIRRIKQNYTSSEPVNLLTIFDALEYRTEAIFITERRTSINLSRYHFARDSGHNVEIISDGKEPCKLCLSKLTIIEGDDNLGEGKLPSFHPFCNCMVRVVERGKPNDF